MLGPCGLGLFPVFLFQLVVAFLVDLKFHAANSCHALNWLSIDDSEVVGSVGVFSHGGGGDGGFFSGLIFVAIDGEWEVVF